VAPINNFVNANPGVKYHLLWELFNLFIVLLLVHSWLYYGLKKNVKDITDDIRTLKSEKGTF
jgi:hypothetical protein